MYSNADTYCTVVPVLSSVETCHPNLSWWEQNVERVLSGRLYSAVPQNRTGLESIDRQTDRTACKSDGSNGGAIVQNRARRRYPRCSNDCSCAFRRKKYGSRITKNAAVQRIQWCHELGFLGRRLATRGGEVGDLR